MKIDTLTISFINLDDEDDNANAEISDVLRDLSDNILANGIASTFEFELCPKNSIVDWKPQTTF